MVPGRTIRLKRGDTFHYGGQAKLNGVVQSFTGWTLASQLRDRDGVLVASLTPQWYDAATGVFQLYAGNTGTWDQRWYKFDVQLTAPSGSVISTPTFMLILDEDMSHG